MITCDMSLFLILLAGIASTALGQDAITCEFGTVERGYLSEPLEACHIKNQTIGGAGFTISTPKSLTIQAFEIRNNKDVKYLPDGIGSKFPELIDYRVLNCALGSIGGEFNSLPNLKYLNLVRNEIVVIESGAFAGLTAMEYLDLSDNKIVNLDANIFHGLINLAQLWMDNNMIVNLHENLFKSLRNLESLQLKINRIETLHENLFDDLVGLRLMSMMNNSLTSLSGNIFKNNRGLEVVSFKENKLMAIDPKIFEGKNFTRVNLSSNKCVNTVYDLPEAFDQMINDLKTKCKP